jgi:hypothetical protein
VVVCQGLSNSSILPANYVKFPFPNSEQTWPNAIGWLDDPASGIGLKSPRSKRTPRSKRGMNRREKRDLRFNACAKPFLSDILTTSFATSLCGMSRSSPGPFVGPPLAAQALKRLLQTIPGPGSLQKPITYPELARDER